MGIRKAAGAGAGEVTTVGRKRITISRISDANAGLIESCGFGVLGVAVGAFRPGVVAVLIDSCARGGGNEGAFMGFTVADFERVLGVELTEFAAVVEVAAEFGARHHGISEVALAVKFFVAEGPAGDTAFGRGGESAQAGVEGAEDGAGHFHERPGEDEWENLDGDAENEAEAVVGGGDERPAGELRSAKEEAEHGVENKHLEEELLPFLEPFFGVGEEVGDEGERRNHNEEGDEGLASGDGQEARDDGNNCTEEDWKEHPEERGATAGRADDDTSDADAGNDRGDDFAERDVGDFASLAIGDDRLLNAGKEFAESGSDDITEVDGERTDDEAEVDEDDGDDKAREDAFDAVVVDAKAGELRINDDKEEDDEDDVGDVAGVLPDEVDGRVGFHTKGWNNRKTIYNVVDSINEFGDDTGGWTDNPSEGADLVFAGVRLVFCARVFWVVGVGGGVAIINFNVVSRVTGVARCVVDVDIIPVVVWVGVVNLDVVARVGVLIIILRLVVELDIVP